MKIEADLLREYVTVRNLCNTVDGVRLRECYYLVGEGSPERWKLVGTIVLFSYWKGRLQTSRVLSFHLCSDCFRRHAFHIGILYTSNKDMHVSTR